MSRPIKQDKKKLISIKLPPYLLAWLDSQPDSRPVLIENALVNYYKINHKTNDISQDV